MKTSLGSSAWRPSVLVSPRFSYHLHLLTVGRCLKWATMCFLIQGPVYFGRRIKSRKWSSALWNPRIKSYQAASPKKGTCSLCDLLRREHGLLLYPAPLQIRKTARYQMDFCKCLWSAIRWHRWGFFFLLFFSPGKWAYNWWGCDDPGQVLPSGSRCSPSITRSCSSGFTLNGKCERVLWIILLRCKVRWDSVSPQSLQV